MSVSRQPAQLVQGPTWCRRCAGTPGDGKRAVWVIARQHPGESMAEWFMQVGPAGGGLLQNPCQPHASLHACTSNLIAGHNTTRQA
jgi:hypothetical protein